MSKGTILVTGATGFTGGRLAEMLREQGLPVRALVRDGSDVSRLEAAGVEVVRGDLRDADAVRRAARGTSLAYHVAATYRHGGIPRAEYFAINVEGTRHLLEAAREAGVKRVVHTSTVGVQGHVEHPPATEDAPFRPGDAYQESKLEGEKLALSFHATTGLPITVVRPVGIHGPGDLRFLKLFRSVARGRFVMIGSGKVLYHMTYVDDLCRGMILAATHPGAVGRVYTIGGPPAVTLQELVAMIARAVGARPPRWRVPFWPVYGASAVCELLWKVLPGNPPLYPRRVDFFRKDRSFDCTRARTELGYEPEVPLEEGLRRTADWYRAKGLL